jgi:transcriptional regulator with XRE-family HTH domain
MLFGAQIRAARGLLGWSQQHLAEVAEVGLSTVRRMEAVDGVVPGNIVSAMRIRSALENSGVEFIDQGKRGPGVILVEPL